MKKLLKSLSFFLVSAAVSVPLLLSGQMTPKLGSRSGSPQSNAAQVAPSRKSYQGIGLNIREAAAHASQFSYIKDSFIPEGNPFSMMKAAAGGIEFMGWVYLSNPGTGQNVDAHHGLYSFDVNGEFTPLVEQRDNLSDGGMAGLFVDGKYHYYYTSAVTWPQLQYKHRTYNSESGWSMTEENITNEQMPRALCSNGEVSYGCFFQGYDSYDNPVFEFGKFDHKTSDHSVIATLPKNWTACAFGNDGYVYAIDMGGFLQKVDVSTGEMTQIGFTGCNPKFQSDAVIDIKSGRMFWTTALASGYGKLYEVDKSTGRATQLVSFKYGDHIVGLNIMHQAWGGAPAAVENLTWNFPDDALSGSVSFVCPTKTYDGSPLTGNLSYTVNADGSEYKTGLCQPGQTVTVPVSFSEAGMRVISVSVSNADGTGPRGIIRTFIGKDTPVAPEVSISYSDGSFNVSWNAVTETVNGGYMDPEKVTYRVTRHPDETVVAEAVKGTSLTDPVAEPSSYVAYSYSVQAVWDGIESGAGISNIIGIGAIVPPYREDFQKQSSFDNFTVLNSNNDSETWNWYYTYVRIGNTYNKMDDWLISPALKLEAGKRYLISIDAKAHNEDYPERLEIKVGKAPTAEAMTNTVVGPTEISQTYPYVTVGDYFECKETGTYYVGIHGISDARRFYLNVDNLSVGTGIGGESPAKVDDFKVVSDPTGEYNAIITGKAPVKTGTGSALASLSKIDLFRDGKLIKTVSPVKPGEDFRYVDPVGVKGTYTYSAVCYNGNGGSEEASITMKVGYAVPARVGDVKVVETSPGKVTVTWTAPTKDAEGSDLGDCKLTYKIVNALSTSEVYAEDVDGTSYTYDVTDESQRFFAAGVYACNFAGESEISYSAMIAAGNAYGMPYAESFADGKISTVLATRTFNGTAASWGARKDNQVEGVTSSDGDNGYLSAKFSFSEDVSMMFTGKIDLTASSNPYFSVDIYNRHTSEFAQADANQLEVMVSEANSNEWKTVKSGTFTELCGDDMSQWVSVSADLAEYKGKTIQVGLRVSCYHYSLALFDNMKVTELSAHDLALVSLTAPAKVKPNEEFEVKAAVANNGYENAENYKVEFYRGKTLVGSIDGGPIAPKEMKEFMVKQTLGFGDGDASAEYLCKVVYGQDSNQADNTASVEVTRNMSNKRSPENLQGKSDGKNVSLSWNAPSGGQGMAVTDTFDEEDSWAYENVGGWTFIDGDGGQIGGFEGIEIPNNPSYSSRAFFVFDNSNKDLFNNTYDMHSGSKCLASMFLFSGAACDDWAVSPELDGSAQTISFWARSYDATYPEHIEILYSLSGKEMSDFISVEEDGSVPREWTEYTFDVPEGTKYFAIRSKATDAFMLMIDDVTYIPVASEAIGYNVYRNGVKINEAPVEGTWFKDMNAEIGLHKYVVTALYENGEESAPSNEIEVLNDPAGVESVFTGIEVRSGRGFIRISGAEGRQIAVADVNGYTYYNGVPSEEVYLRLTSGIYVVRVESRTLKVNVK